MKTGMRLGWMIVVGSVFNIWTTANAENAIGCKFQSSLCESVEVCVDDDVFGQCQAEPFDVHQYNLEPAEEELVRLELTRLALRGEDWASSSVQCVLRYFFLTHRYGLIYDQNFCNVRDPDYMIQLIQASEKGFTDDPNSISDLTQVGPTDETDQPEEDSIINQDQSPNTTQDGEIDLETRISPDTDDEAPELSAEESPVENYKFFMSPDEERVLHSYISQMIRGERPDFSSLPSDELQKFVAYIDLLKAAANNRMQVNTGEVVSDDEIQGPADLEKLLYKKDEEKLGILDQGIGGKEHRIQTREPQTATVASAVVESDGKWIQGDRVYIKLTTNLTDDDMVKELMAYLEEKIGEPNNVTFSDVRVQDDQVSFRVENLDQLTPEWLRDVLKLPASTNLMNTAEVAKETFQLLKKDKFVAEVGLADAEEKNNAIPLERADGDDGFVVPTLIVCGLVILSLFTVLAIYFYRSRIQAKSTLERLAADFECAPGKDYEELCRQRMSVKSEGPEPLSGIVGTLAQRLGSQSEPSPPPAYGQSTRSSISSWSEEPVQTNMDISTGHMILSYMEDHLLNKDRLEQEWKELEAYQPDMAVANVGNGKQNQDKNRCKEIIPYDHNRVVLKESGNNTGSDYINASFICDHDPRNPAYIATQGPLPETVADFWQMVWEQGSVVIVNLTKVIEGGETKCYRYWPENGSEVHQVYEVHLVSEHIWCEDYLVRSFYLKNLRTQETRTVTQFHFLTWPDDGIPTSSKALLEFRRKVNKSYRGRSCPVIVHCSDGSGRTGTYCLLDMVMIRISKGVKEIDIAAALEHLRDQRMKSIGTKGQFEFVLSSVAEEIQAVLKALPQ